MVAGVVVGVIGSVVVALQLLLVVNVLDVSVEFG